MNTFLWILQVLLAICFVYSGIMKSTQSRDDLVRMGQTGVANLRYSTIRFIGVTEIAGSMGIIVPWSTGIMPLLTPLTALCFAVIMILAAPIHYKRREYKPVALNVIVFCISLFVAYMRFKGLT